MLDDSKSRQNASLPGWVPDAARRYLAHVESGQSIRFIARRAGCHASTVLRQVRRTEQRREDLLVDLALSRLGDGHSPSTQDGTAKGTTSTMSTCDLTETKSVPDDEEFRRTATRILRRLNETGASLAIARDMEKAVVVRDTPDGQTIRTAVVERSVAEAMALKDWLSQIAEGRIARYTINGPGRMALRRFMAE